MTERRLVTPAKTGPQSLLTRVRAHLQQLPFSLKLQALSLAEGLRAALSVAVIIAANEYLQWPSLS